MAAKSRRAAVPPPDVGAESGAAPEIRVPPTRTTIRFTAVNHARLRTLMHRLGVDMNTAVNVAVAALHAGQIESQPAVALP